MEIREDLTYSVLNMASLLSGVDDDVRVWPRHRAKAYEAVTREGEIYELSPGDETSRGNVPPDVRASVLRLAERNRTASDPVVVDSVLQGFDMEHMPVLTDTAGEITVTSDRKKVRDVTPGAELWRRGGDILLVIDGADVARWELKAVAVDGRCVADLVVGPEHLLGILSRPTLQNALGAELIRSYEEDAAPTPT